MALSRTLPVAFLALMAFQPALGAGTDGCESFAFPVATELAWLRAAEITPVASGATLKAPPQQAMDVTLLPMAEVSFPVTPEGKSKDGEPAYGAVIKFEASLPAGLYQISLSGKGWIDAVQDGKPVKAVAHSGKSDCEGLRKSVRFELKEAPLTVQLSGSASPSLKITVRKTD